MKRVLPILLSLSILFSYSVSVFADEEVVVGQQQEMFDIVSKYENTEVDNALVDETVDEVVDETVVTDQQQGGFNITSNYENSDVVNEFLRQKDSITNILSINLARDGYFLEKVSIGTPFNLYGTEEYYFPVMDDENIITFVQISYTIEGVSVGIGKYFAESLSNLDKSRTYTIYMDRDDNVFAVSGTEEFLISEIESDTLEGELIVPEVVKQSSLEEEVVNIQEDISKIILPSQWARAMTSGKWLYNYPAMQQTTSDNCWATSMAILLNGRGISTTVAQVISKTGSTTANASKVSQLFNQYYGMSTGAYNYAYFSDYVSEVNNGRAVYQSLDGDSSGNHAVVVIGYAYDNQSGVDGWVTFRDPATGSTYDRQVIGGKFVHNMRSSISIVYNIR